MMHPLTAAGYEISTDKTRLDITVIHQYLSAESYWAKNIPLATVTRSIEGSLCFGVYHHNKQVAFARMITDCATFGYLADVFVLPEHRGKGVARWLMDTIINYPSLQGLRRWMLVTKDAHALYRAVGFTAVDMPERIMQLRPFSAYPEPAG